MVSTVLNETGYPLLSSDVHPGLGRLVINSGPEIQGPTPEQQRLLSASVELAEAITDQYPQTDRQGRLEYAIAGSLAVMLLAQASSFEELDHAQIPGVVAARQVQVPEIASRRLQTFARHLGDFDYVPTGQYAYKKGAARVADYDAAPESSGQSVAQYLWAGGTEIPRLTQQARDLLRLPPGGLLSADPVGEFTESRAVRLRVDGQDFYIVDPRIIVGFRAVHLLEAFDTSAKPEKFITDLMILREGIGQIYSDEELAQTTHDLLMGYKPHDANTLQVPYRNPGLPAALREFIDRAIALDQDAPYLQQLQFGQERGVGILKILHRYEAPAAKQQVIDFINSHREQIDRWTVNKYSERNIGLLADFIDSHPAIKAELAGNLYEDEAAVLEAQGTASWLRNNPYMEDREDLLSLMQEDHDGLDYLPLPSDHLQLLMYIDESDVARQLATVEQLIARAAGTALEVRALLGAEIMQDKAIKRSIMSGLAYALENFDDQVMTQCFRAVEAAASGWVKDNGEMIELADRPELIRGALTTFGLPSSDISKQ